MQNKVICRNTVAVLKVIVILIIFAAMVGFLWLSSLEAAEVNVKAEVEGKIMFYTTTDAEKCKILTDAFMQLYPKIEALYVRSGSSQLAERILAEARGGKSVWDVVLTTPLYSQVFNNKGLLAPYDSPERKYYRDGYKDKQGIWTSVYTNYTIFGYNTKQLSKKSVPASYHDLLKPEWRGQIGMESKAYEWFATVVNYMGVEKGLTFMRQLAQQKLQLRSGRGLLTQLVAAGEIKGTLATFNQHFENAKAAGAPVEWVALDPVFAYLHPIGLSAKAPHPNAGKLFIDFILSRKGQEIIRSVMLIPDHMDILPDPPRLVAGITPVFPPPDVFDNFDKYIKLFNETILRK